MAEAEQEETVTGAEGLLPEPLALKEELLDRPSSPEANCSICLEELRNKSYTDTCTHQFCFSCLLQWSKIKPECPLCKQRFRSIYYNFKACGTHDKIEIDTSPVMAPVPDVEPTVLINLAFDRPRFRYRSTLSHAMLYIGNVIGAYRSPSGGRMATSDFRRRRQLGTSEFRRNIYRQGMWVRRSPEGRVRECSPEFYRLNPAQTHRLVPWLNRELNVLLDLSLDSHSVSMEILNLITVYPILSSQFNRALRRYLGVRTAHFVHEFYSFATSPYDMLAYDIHAEYSSVENMNDPNNYEEPDRREPEDDDDDDDDDNSDIEVIVESTAPETISSPDVSSLIPVDLSTIPGPSRTSGGVNRSRFFGTLDTPIVISDDEEHQSLLENNHDSIDVEDLANNSDSSIEYLASLPPRHLRTPEIITICSDEESNPCMEDRVENIDGTSNGDYGVAVPTSQPSYNIPNSVVTEEDCISHNTRRKKRKTGSVPAPLKYDYSSAEESDRKVKRKKAKSKSKSSKKSKRRKTDVHSPSSSKTKHSRNVEIKNETLSSDSEFEVNTGAQKVKNYSVDEVRDTSQTRKPARLKSVVKVVNSDSSEITQMDPGFSGSSRSTRWKTCKKYLSSSDSDSEPRATRCSKRTKQQVHYYSESSKYSALSDSDGGY